MESLIEVNRSHKSDNHETSQMSINYPHSSQLHAYATARKYEKQFRRCKSYTDIEKRTKINNIMGSRVSRSHSSDNMMVNSVSFVYEPLNRKNLLVNQDIVSDNDDSDDYKLLDSSSDDESDVNDNNEFSNVKLNISNNDDCHECPIKDSNDINDDSIDDDDNNGSYETTTNTMSINCDGQQQYDNMDENSCTIITKSTNGHTIQFNVNETSPSSSNDNCSFIKKFSTLPRIKSHESNNVHNENCVRRSYKVPRKRTDVLNEREIEEVKKPVKLENVNNNCECSSSTMLNIHENNAHHDNVINDIQKSDKISDSLFHCTTLPKARSRMSEPLHFRHSFRHSFDPERPRKCLSEFNASGIETTVVNCDESTSGAESAINTRAVKRSRSNLSWLRKSMKKLNPFQMPQEIESPPNNTIPPSTSHDINPQTNAVPSECEKENQFENGNEFRVALNNENSPQVNDVTSENTNMPDLFNVVLLEQQPQHGMNDGRPRQYGRRSNPVRISSLAADSLNHSAARIIAHHQQQERPNSAPVVNRTPSQRNAHRPRQSLPSEQSSLASSRNSSPVSMVSSTGSSSIPDVITTIHDIHPRFTAAGISTNNSEDDDRDQNDNSSESKSTWPYLISRPITCLFCTLGLFNISRFAIFSVHFGANFLVQFLLLSFIFGIPFLWLQIVLGHKIKGGIVTMFKIAPICVGIGIALMITHCIISLYSSVSIAWVLIYLRDSMISSDEHYLWEERFDSYRGYQNISALRLSENIADYFNGVVLQRLSGIANTPDGKMRFQLAFNVSIVWILVFIVLSRGIKSLGKIMIGMCLVCFLGLAAVCIKFLTLLNFETVQDIFPATDWQEFFANSHSWSVAAQEVFLTWGIQGVSIYAMYCKSGKNQRLNNYILRREALLIVFLTLFGLFLGGVLGSTCIIILKLNGFNYFPASFENPKNDIFLWPVHYASLPSFHHSIPSKWITRYSNVVGECSERPIFVNQQGQQIYKESGYKPLRLITEILPSTLAISSRIEPIWGTIAFLCLFLFGIGQLCVMWKSISGAIGNSISAILLSCVTGLFLGIPMTTDIGIVIMHFLDNIFGGSWFIPILWTSYLLAIFMVRGRPYSSDLLVKELRLTETLSAFMAFSWNVLLPVGFLLLSVMEYKKSHSNELFHQRNILSLSHMSNWPLWVKQVGGLLQVSLLILLPCVALVQIYIYLSRGPRDVLERIERLFRPPLDTGDTNSLSHIPIRRLCQPNLAQSNPITTNLNENNNNNVISDEPPKYSPPPSYGKAMGLRVAKVLRNSIRRSVRRLRRGDNTTGTINGTTIVPTISSNVESRPQSHPTTSRPTILGQNFNEFIRSSIRRINRSSQSTEQLVLSDISVASTNSHIV
ncbi:sodium-dependent transporter bedraggled [Chironomus tepperi]|uniref:sodium-dependent transporter bedraggled n=1 Tax=Chironomus tepperi TaxID=113505 RepID=UPI00391F74BA